MTSTAWFTHDRFGMFIHWGLYSNPAGVWKGQKMKHPYSEWLQASEHIPREEYRALAASFNPSDFCADEWIRTVRDAGMKYFIITAKHHDGFALWPTKASTFNVFDETPFKRDILGELADACKKYDIKLGFYYSHWQDWEGTGGDICEVHMANEEYTHPSQDEFEHYWQNKCLVQIRELIENYDPDILWFDSWHDYKKLGCDYTAKYVPAARQEELISLIRSLSDKCLVNSRINYCNPSDNVDYLSMMDNHFPEEAFDKPWETSGTLNESWAYHSEDYSWKSTQQLIQHLTSNASFGGNYQLNVGPMGNGRFQPAATKRLREIGTWFDANSESIYGTEASPLGKMAWGRITAKDLSQSTTTLYLHLNPLQPEAALFIEGVTAQSANAKVLETGQPVKTVLSEEGICVRLPAEINGCTSPVIELQLTQMTLPK
ncbi:MULTISPECIES: alpha-L-fucosidase [unclassified Lentimonas]|uniref:alpha-L-fucosidase n=1 Tax=unclassified Lentimonas TaxID=2630993 RepID=UPI0013220011|nr:MULTISPECIES: alpha-L-fucosidase [unclassified Lentimonas]CAA6679204.1 Alpha-L-fucosidase (EC [Lentimonas sp. CC4]CAA6685868.1 Alpha-L-fucosidase (EC [Lentimonas sp. CC6]CAA7076041.1 Alpha-L-fucosidase (EC [Lentimonas sp. CC4]CAA7168526.1 Alpha-L-fucosidase (EC [Lentimonas sp. CC21]CAA7180920.1 Alpha-L-fucosidase (EC [Lentimonas sp. CC8]